MGKVYRDPFEDVILIVTSQHPLGQSRIPNELLLKKQKKKDGCLDLHTFNDSTLPRNHPLPSPPSPFNHHLTTPSPPRIAWLGGRSVRAEGAKPERGSAASG